MFVLLATIFMMPFITSDLQSPESHSRDDPIILRFFNFEEGEVPEEFKSLPLEGENQLLSGHAIFNNGQEFKALDLQHAMLVSITKTRVYLGCDQDCKSRTMYHHGKPKKEALKDILTDTVHSASSYNMQLIDETFGADFKYFESDDFEHAKKRKYFISIPQ